jgi:hypothetical protein
VSVDPRSPRIDRDNPGRARADGVRCHAAHGGVCFAEYCSCGAWRVVEVNVGGSRISDSIRIH